MKIRKNLTQIMSIHSNQTFFIKQVEDPHLCFDQVNDRLVVIEIYQRPRDVLFHVLLLLQLEHMLKMRDTAVEWSELIKRLCTGVFICSDFWLVPSHTKLNCC